MTDPITTKKKLQTKSDSETDPTMSASSHGNLFLQLTVKKLNAMNFRK